MRVAKSGDWWKENVQRALANNSFVAKEKPDVGLFMREWLSLYESRSGERGIFSRQASKKQAEKFGRRDPEHDFGTNPCSEIILRSREFCNLTEVVVRGDDTPESLKRKVKLATILGTFQSTLTNFKYLSKKWQENCAEERLLGVSLTGIMDNEYTNGTNTKNDIKVMLETLRDEAVKTNKLWAAKLNIPVSAAITCVKPSGTVSQLVDSASGIHARHSPYYIRTVRADKKDPLAVMMKDMGFPCEDDVMKPEHTYVFSFPIKSPDHAIYRTQMTAIDQLKLWLVYQRHWCEHKPSVTISVKEEEWPEVGAWVYNHFDEMSGVSFLPFSDHVYQQAPYQDCTKEEYEALAAKMPKNIDWTLLANYEKRDSTTGSQELACVAGGCEI
jgi:ribonucleoside-diphosphate reductase alpha chain